MRDRITPWAEDDVDKVRYQFQAKAVGALMNTLVRGAFLHVRGDKTCMSCGYLVCGCNRSYDPVVKVVDVKPVTRKLTSGKQGRTITTKILKNRPVEVSDDSGKPLAPLFTADKYYMAWSPLDAGATVLRVKGHGKYNGAAAAKILTDKWGTPTWAGYRLGPPPGAFGGPAKYHAIPVGNTLKETRKRIHQIVGLAEKPKTKPQAWRGKSPWDIAMALSKALGTPVLSWTDGDVTAIGFGRKSAFRFFKKTWRQDPYWQCRAVLVKMLDAKQITIPEYNMALVALEAMFPGEEMDI